jgi:hypothetical protein
MMTTSGFTCELTTTAQPTSLGSEGEMGGSEGEPQMTGVSERETVPPVVTKQTEVHVDTGAIVGGAVAIVFIVTTGVVIVLMLLFCLVFKLKHIGTVKPIAR